MPLKNVLPPALTFIITVFLLPSLSAQELKGVVELGQVKKYHIPSRVNQRTYEVSIHLPEGYRPGDSARYPTLYVLDGNLYMPLVSTLQQLLQGDELIRPLIVVGIGYPVSGFGETYALRAQDFTPSSSPQMDSLLSVLFQQKVVTGGAASFAEVVEKEIVPFVERTYKTNQNRALFGHSFGGLFAAHMVTRPQSPFQHLLICSAALDWDDQYVLKEASKVADRRSLPLRVFLAVGADDEKTIVRSTQQFETLLQPFAGDNLILKSEVFTRQKHMSAVAPALSNGMRLVAGK